MNAEHLLEQAEQLAARGIGRPRQADLRRAVSAAYYALFHLLTQDGARRIAPTSHARFLVAREFDHKSMKDVSSKFASRQPPPSLQNLIPAIPDDLRTVAEAFLALQIARHTADYDLSRRPTRAEVGFFIRQARTALDAWQRVRNHSAAEAYLLMMLLPKLGSRG
jgi:uncharacterized protein (UPF0332 family)